MTNNKRLRRMRRWVTLILCFMLTVSSLAVFAAGAETAAASLSVSDVQVTAGNYFTVYLRAENFSQVGAVDLYAFYDPDVMTVVGSYRQGVADNAQVSIYTDTPGEACFSAISMDGMSGSGYIWSIEFYVDEQASAGRHSVIFAVGDAYDLAFNTVSIAGDSCTVTVDSAVPPQKTAWVGGRGYYDGYKKGDRITVQYYGSSIEDLASADFVLTYDEDLLAPVSVSPGDSLKSTNGALWSVNDRTPGYIKISYAALTGVWGWVDPIVTATFEVVGDVTQDCYTSVSLDLENVYDSSLVPMLGSGAVSEILLLWEEPTVVLPEITLGKYGEVDKDTFTLSVLVPGTTGLAAGDFTLTYDPALLQCTGVVSGDPNGMIISNIKQKDGKVLFSYICEDGITADTEIARLTFKVLDCGNSNGGLTLNGKNLVNADFDAIAITVGDVPALPILSHQLTYVAAKEPTCEEVGWYDYETCSRCGHSTYAEIPPLGHDYKAVITPPTCTEAGYTTHTCSRCGGSYADSHVDALGHRIMVDGRVWVDAITTKNDGVYPFVLENGVYSSTNKENNSDSFFVITAEYDGALYLSYAVSSEQGFDRLIIQKNGYTLEDISGSVDWSSHVLQLNAGDVVTINYHKDVSVNFGEDTGWFTFSCDQVEIGSLVTVPAETMDPTCTEAVICDFCRAEVKKALGHDFSPDWTIDLAPTCTEAGSQSHHCTRCDAKDEVTEIPANGHSYGEWYEVLAPTCTVTGTDEHTCSVCGHTETKTTDALGHKPADAVVENRVEPNCTDKGSYDSVVYCSVCDEELSREKMVIDELGHNFSPDWTIDLAPTCTEVGSQSHHCTRCDAKDEVTEIPANGHSYGEWYEVLSPTCTATGTDEHKCSVCGHTETKTTDALGHKPADAVVENRVEPNCTDKGSYDSVVYCSVCDEELSREKMVIDELGHNFSTIWTIDLAPTCTEVGSQSHHCTRCDAKDEVTEIPANGHSYGEWYEVLAPTCTATGTDEHKCSVCGHTETKTTNALGHKPADAVVENRVEPNCTDKGSYDSVVYCSVCDEELSRENIVIDELGHNFSPDWTTDIYPTCTEVGSKSHHCTRCDAKDEVTEIPANGHSYGEWYEVLAPTCTATGTDEHKCSVCGHTETKTTDALGHKPADAVVENRVEPNCTDKGSYDSVVYCSVCDEELSREKMVINELGHDFNSEWTTDIYPTCTEVGSQSHHCTRCDAKDEVTEIPANGHSYGEWYEVLAPTCTATGTDEHKCSVCGHTETKTTDALGHKPADAVVENRVEPNCTDKGSYDSVVYCSVCDEELSREKMVIDELGHDYKANVILPTCTTAGYTENSCSRCQDHYVDNEVEAIGHTPGDWIVDCEPDIGVEGNRHKECITCGEVVQTEALEALPSETESEMPETDPGETETESVPPIEDTSAEPVETTPNQGGCSGSVFSPACLLILLTALMPFALQRKKENE